MKNNIFIPKKIKVGYQHREDTFTQKLAYVTYFDSKGVLRKETSWKSWCQLEDKSHYRYVDGKSEVTEIIPGIPADDYDNVPIEGFVLNKKVGGYKSDWNFRSTYCRVYDPRGFEFEITIPNLLYILENATSTKGKGLEGKFVYGWDGKDLVLIPEEAPEFVKMMAFTDLQDKKILKKDLIVGRKYLDNKGKEYIYLCNDYEYDKGVPSDVKKLWFYFDGELKYYQEERYRYSTILMSNIKKDTGEDCHNIADILDGLEQKESFKPAELYKMVFQPVTAQDVQGIEKMSNWEFYRIKFAVQQNGKFHNIDINTDGRYNYYRNTPKFSISNKTKTIVDGNEYHFSELNRKYNLYILKKVKQ